MGLLKLGEAEVSANIDVFILEDTPLYQKRVVACLKAIGFTGKLTIAGSLAEAKKLITVERPGLILSDWNLPDGIGIDFVKLVRSEKKFDQTPIIMVTTMDEVSHIIKALQVGADDYVVKPFYESDVSEKLGFAFEKRLAQGPQTLGFTPKLSF